MSGKVAKGSWTLKEINQRLYEFPSDVPMSDPISEKVQTALTATVSYDLYPFVLELISTPDGFISKRLAMAFLDWMVIDRHEWKVDPDKMISLRRLRVEKFVQRVKGQTVVVDTQDMLSANKILSQVERNKFWNLSKKDFSLVTMFVSQEARLPLFQVLDALNMLTRNGYDVSAALGSVLIWRNHISPEFIPTQIDLL